MTTSRDIYHNPLRMSQLTFRLECDINLSLDRIKSSTNSSITIRGGLARWINFPSSVVVVAGQAILGFDTGRDAHKLVDESVRLFRDFNAPMAGYVMQI